MLSDTRWKLEQAKTRLDIDASQCGYWSRWLFRFWLLSIVIIVMVSCDEPKRKEYAATWVIATVTWTQQVNHKGDYYNRVKMRDALNESVYQGTLWDWCRWVLLMSVLPTSAGVVLFLRWARRPSDHTRHIRGAEFLEVKELQRRLTAEGPAGIRIAGLTIPKDLECKHMILSGATGTGKSVALRDLLLQYQAMGDPVIVVDPHGEFTAQFYDPSRGDVILNPLDARSVIWTPWAEGESDQAIQAQAARLFPVVPGQHEGVSYYHEAAQRAYRELLKRARVHDPRHIPDMLAEAVKSKAPWLGSKDVISGLQNALDAFRYLPPGQPNWSAREWAANPRGWVFLTFQSRDKAAVLPLISLWLESLTGELLSRPIGALPVVRIVFDEVATLSAQPTLADLLSGGRKYNVSLTMAIQDKEQLYAIYGKSFTNNMLNQPRVRVFFSTNDGETQKWSAENIGQEETLEIRETETVGPADARDAVSRGHSPREKWLVTPSMFGMLKERECYVRVAHLGTTKVRLPGLWAVKNQPAFIPRADAAVSAPVQPRTVRRI